MTPNFYYTTGEPVRAGDRIIADRNKFGTVKYILAPGSDAASLHACSISGGIMLDFENGDSQLWTAADEDLEFISRDVEMLDDDE